MHKIISDSSNIADATAKSNLITAKMTSMNFDC